MIDLKAIRLAAGLTQKDLAARLGLSERSGRVTVAQIEARTDWTLSGLVAYIRAASGTGVLLVDVAGERFEFSLD